MIITKFSCSIFLILLFFPSPEIFCQVKTQGTPFIKNYPAADYKLHPNNYAIVQDDQGMMYFGNAYGVLAFDGNTWDALDLPSGKSAMSLVKDKKGRIHVGSVSDVGSLQPGASGKPTYTSLLNKIPEKDRSFEEVWRTYSVDNQLVFVSLSSILIYNKDTFKILKPSQQEMVFDFSGEANTHLYFRESGKGLMQLKEDGTLTLVHGGERFATKMIYAVLPYQKDELLILASDGAIIFNGHDYRVLNCPLNDLIRQYPVTKGICLKNDRYAIGTLQKGLIIFDHKGNPMQMLNKGNGLLSNAIADLYADHEDNLWLATDNGISYVHTSSPFTLINENDGLQGMGYAAFVHDKKIYLGTSQGVFVKALDETQSTMDNPERFQPVKNTGEQVWYLGEAGGTLLCGDTRGLFIIRNNEAIQISPGDYTGGWIFKPFKNNYLILGTYYGLALYEKKAGTWTFKNKISGFDESSRALEIDDENNIWVCHGNNGLFKVSLNEKLDSAIAVENITLSQGFKSNYFNDLTKIENEIIFTSDQAIYKYNPSTHKPEKHHSLNSITGGDMLISKIGHQKNGITWLVNKDVIEIVTKQKNGAYHKNTTLFQKLKGQLIGSFEFFWQYDDHNYFIGTQGGFVHFDPTIVKQNKTFAAIIRKVESINNKDSLLYAHTFTPHDTLHHNQPGNPAIEIPFEQNAFRFSCSALFYEDQQENQYQYYLEHIGETDSQWTPWTAVTYKEYTHLPQGDYIFHVKARNVYGGISPEATYGFTILPPWYKTTAAYLAYGVLFVLLMILVARLIILKLNKEKKRIEEEKQKEIILLRNEKLEAEVKLKNGEKEIILLQNEKLEAEVKFKSKEKEIILLQNEKLEAEVKFKNDALANLATTLSQKTEFLTQLKDDLVSINKEIDPAKKLPSLTQLIKRVEKGIAFDDSWDHFQTSFDRVHHNFLHKVREKFPSLKPTDLLLCAYIKMNKSNKEISSLLNISESAVKKRRFRLREKLKLDDDTKLTEFLTIGRLKD